MARCRSWRLRQVDGHVSHRPGKCRECWKPCREKVERGVRRCHDCIMSIVTSPDSDVRRALMQESDVTEEVLELLSDDSNPVIAGTARMRLETLRSESQVSRDQ